MHLTISIQSALEHDTLITTAKRATNRMQTACSNDGQTETSSNAEILKSYKIAHFAIQKTSSFFSNLMACCVQLLNASSCTG